MEGQVWEESKYYWRRQSASMLGPEKSYTLYCRPADKQFKNDNGFPVAVCLLSFGFLFDLRLTIALDVVDVHPVEEGVQRSDSPLQS